MPTERFWKLSEDKKESIRVSAIRELSRVSFEETSINRIIQDAGISRGSFYTYFTDMTDVAGWILKDISLHFQNMAVDQLLARDGDYFGVLEDIFNYMTGEYDMTHDLFGVVQNIIGSKNGANILGLDRVGIPGEMDKKEDLEQIKKLLCPQLADGMDMDRLRSLQMLSASALVFSLRWFYKRPQDIEQIKKSFRTTVDIIKNGAAAN